MFATIRRYTPSTGTFKPAEFDQLRRQIQEEFLPLIKVVDGFHSYYAVGCGDAELITVSVFETREGAAQSSRVAADYIARAKLPVELSRPAVSEGEVVALAEAPPEVGAH
jgi:hypothetical protein